MNVHRQSKSQKIKRETKKFSLEKELETINEQSEMDISISLDERAELMNGADEQGKQEEEEAVASF